MRPFLFFICIIFLFEVCRRSDSVSFILPKDSSGDTLSIAKKFCGSCHLYPDPQLCDKTTWNKTLLPNMGYRLGIKSDSYNPLADLDMVDQALVLQANIYPDHPLISQLDWSKIVDYYLSHAPDSLSLLTPISKPLTAFKVTPLGDRIPYPGLTMMRFDSTLNHIHLGLESGEILTYNSDRFILKDSLLLNGTPLDLVFGRNRAAYYLSVGRINPSQQKLGALYMHSGDSIHLCISALHRPVQMSLGHINKDEYEDAIISEFGYETGKLTWVEGLKEGFGTEVHVLSKSPGIIKTFMEDLDGDKIKDLIALKTQGDEHVSIFMMNDQGLWHEHQVLRFPPIHGACDLDIIDFNKDGRLDIVVSNGDNADYSQIRKPYHGIRIYLNRGDLKFTESMFIPYPGVLHSVVHDFDQDGDLDIAASSFFPGDLTHPLNAFTYFEQVNGFFVNKSFPQSNFGKWMVITSGDFDHDGDEDLLLGSFMLNKFLVQGSREDQKKHALILLDNQLIVSNKSMKSSTK